MPIRLSCSTGCLESVLRTIQHIGLHDAEIVITDETHFERASTFIEGPRHDQAQRCAECRREGSSVGVGLEITHDSGRRGLDESDCAETSKVRSGDGEKEGPHTDAAHPGNLPTNHRLRQGRRDWNDMCSSSDGDGGLSQRGGKHQAKQCKARQIHKGSKDDGSEASGSQTRISSALSDQGSRSSDHDDSRPGESQQPSLAAAAVSKRTSSGAESSEDSTGPLKAMSNKRLREIAKDAGLISADQRMSRPDLLRTLRPLFHSP